MSAVTTRVRPEQDWGRACSLGHYQWCVQCLPLAPGSMETHSPSRHAVGACERQWAPARGRGPGQAHHREVSRKWGGISRQPSPQIPRKVLQCGHSSTALTPLQRGDSSHLLRHGRFVPPLSRVAPHETAVLECQFQQQRQADT